MAIHRLSIEDFDEVNYELVAIHTSLEDYRLAYFINQNLRVLLSKNKDEIHASSKDGEAYFSRFTYEMPESDSIWNLIQNKNEILISKTGQGDLFTDEMPVRIYLIPEFKKVDYFLKIENQGENIAEIIEGLQSIARISTVYPVDPHHIKSKNNLIF